MRAARYLAAVDSHTEGMPTRVITGGVGKIAVRGSGAMIILGGLSLLLGLYPLVGIALIVLFIIPVASIMHNFWTIQDPMQRQMDMTFFMKDFCMLGCTLMFVAIPQPWALSLAF